jgi:GT2 family glycosyltransferase
MSTPLVSVIIVSFNTREVLRQCLQHLDAEVRNGFQAPDSQLETVVVDNASRDGSADMVERDFAHVSLIRSETNLGFGPANNLGFAAARGRYLVLLNSDAFLKPGSLIRAIRHMQADPTVGMGGARLIGRDGEFQPSARMFPSLFNDALALTGLAARFPRSRLLGRADRTWADPSQPCEADWVPGAFAVVRRDLLERTGAFDERFFLYYEEVDLCRRIKAAGSTVRYWPDVEVVHLGGESSKTVRRLAMQSSGAQLALWRMRSALIYYRKNHGALAAWLARVLEIGWHRLRALKNRAARGADAIAKRDESLAVIALMRTAWSDTRGGRVSPPQPW